jgi:hypothetical protein
LPLASVSPLRVVAPEIETWMPGNVAPRGSVTVIAIPARLAGARRGCAGAAVGGAVGLGCVVPCGGLAGVLGAWAPTATALTMMKLSRNDVRMMHIIYRSRRV